MTDPDRQESVSEEEFDIWAHTPKEEYLRGWSLGDEPIHLRTPLVVSPDTPTQKVDQLLPFAPTYPPPKEQLTEYPLQVFKKDDPHRRNLQLAHANRVLRNGGLVLLTPRHTIFQAQSIWGLIWAYFKFKLFRGKRG